MERQQHQQHLARAGRSRGKERRLFLSVCCVLALGAKVEFETGRASAVGCPCHVLYRSLDVPNRLGNHTAIADDTEMKIGMKFWSPTSKTRQ